MAHTFCTGYVHEPYQTLVGDYPGEDVYPPADFRTEWGPIFHRGRLDGTARVLVLGQDPAVHESIARRILVGEAGQRVQGLLARAGVTTSYVMLNTFLYSVYGQGGGQRHADDPAIAVYRNRWLDAVLLDSRVTAVVTLGVLAERAFRAWTATGNNAEPAVGAHLHHAPLRHPTYPESASRSGTKTLAEATAELLENWNDHLPQLVDHIDPDTPTPLRPYGSSWQPGDLADIPEADLPAGCPRWWRSLEDWANRTGRDARTKRATIMVVVPEAFRNWPSHD